MAILHPLSKDYCTEKEYEILKRWTEARNNTEIDINTKTLERDLLKVKNTIDKSIAKIFK